MEARYLAISADVLTANAKVGAATEYVGFDVGALLGGTVELRIPLNEELYRAIGVEGEFLSIGAASIIEEGKQTHGASLLIGGYFTFGVGEYANDFQ